MIDKLSVLTEYKIYVSGKTAAGFGVEVTVFKQTLEGGKAVEFLVHFLKDVANTLGSTPHVDKWWVKIENK